MLQDYRVVLTPLISEDLTKLFEWINNEELVSLNSFFRPVTWEAHLKWFSFLRYPTSIR
jgi:hypothetical protein